MKMVLQTTNKTSMKHCSGSTQPTTLCSACMEREQWAVVKGGNYMTANQIAYAKLREDQRHNLADEANRRYAAGASYAAVGESIRHNTAQEGINWYAAQETARHQKMSDATDRLHFFNQGIRNVLTQSQLAEAIRHNRAQELIGQSQAASSRVQASAAAKQANAAFLRQSGDLALSIVRATRGGM